MLNLPSTGSKFAKSFKKCLVAPKGYVIYTCDYSALEDRVIANLSKDKNKCSIFLDGVDGHCLNSCYYFYKDIIKELPKLDNETDIEYYKRFHQEVENGNKILKKFRQNSKGVTSIRRHCIVICNSKLYICWNVLASNVEDNQQVNK